MKNTNTHIPQPSDIDSTTQFEYTNKVESASSLYEIGPRFILAPILILDGVFSGDVLFRDQLLTVYTKKNTKSHREYRRPL